MGKLKALSSGDRTESKKESSTSVESRYARISCSGFTVVRMGSIGGRFHGSGDGPGYAAEEGGERFVLCEQNLVSLGSVNCGRSRAVVRVGGSSISIGLGDSGLELLLEVSNFFC